LGGTSLSDIEAIALETVERFPDGFREAAFEVIIKVEEWPAADVLAEMGISDPADLTGLYDGVPLTQKSIAEPSPYPDIVTLFRAPILRELQERDGVTLQELVAHVTVHEFAHHFGWSDEDIARVDPWWE